MGRHHSIRRLTTGPCHGLPLEPSEPVFWLLRWARVGDPRFPRSARAEPPYQRLPLGLRLPVRNSPTRPALSSQAVLSADCTACATVASTRNPGTDDGRASSPSPAHARNDKSGRIAPHARGGTGLRGGLSILAAAGALARFDRRGRLNVRPSAYCRCGVKPCS
jgi:hypothetical protein